MPAATTTQRGSAPLTLAHPVLAALSIGAGALHLVAANDHPGAIGALFGATAVAQLLWAALVLPGCRRGVLVGGAVGQLGVATAYVVVHTAGWPAGPLAGVVEHVTAAGVIATALALLAAFGAVQALAPHPTPARRSSAVVAGVLVALAVSGGVAAGGESGHSHAEAPTDGAHGHSAAAPR